MFNRYEEAEKDCTQAILLDGSYSKAFARRGTARTFLGKLNEAKQGMTIFMTTGTHSSWWDSQVIASEIGRAFPWSRIQNLEKYIFYQV